MSTKYNKEVIYRWRATHTDHYRTLQRKYMLQRRQFQKAWNELLPLGDLFAY